MRRFLIATALAIVMSSCGATTVDPATIVTAIQAACSFNTTIQMVQAVIASFVGPAGQVTADVAAQVENAICAAVQQKVATTSSVAGTAGAAASSLPVISVVVNGVTVTGTYGKL